jgi:hypothetical protein
VSDINRDDLRNLAEALAAVLAPQLVEALAGRAHDRDAAARFYLCQQVEALEKRLNARLDALAAVLAPAPAGATTTAEQDAADDLALSQRYADDVEAHQRRRWEEAHGADGDEYTPPEQAPRYDDDEDEDTYTAGPSGEGDE